MNKTIRKWQKTGAAVAAAAAILFSGCGQDKIPTSYENGITSLESRDYLKALERFQNAVNKDGQDAEGYRGMGIAYLLLGEYQSAVDAFNKALDADKHPAQNAEFAEDIRFYQAQAYCGLDEYDKAMTLYNQLLTGKRAGEAYLLRGKIYARNGKFGQAGLDFQKAVELNNSYEIYLQVYEVYVENNRQADGAGFLKGIKDNEPKTADEYYQLGRVYYELKELDTAEKYLSTAIEKEVDAAVPVLAQLYLQQGKADRARKAYKTCVEAGRKPSIGYNGLAELEIADGNYAKALEWIEKGLKAVDSDAREELLFNEIVVYEKQLDFQTAYEKLQEFLKSFPINARAKREAAFLESRVAESQQTRQAEKVGNHPEEEKKEEEDKDSDEEEKDDDLDFTDEDGDGYPDELGDNLDYDWSVSGDTGTSDYTYSEETWE
ncbi:MAG: tetratricopeptide repeat protein [Eubacteriales bacterium]|nr:tetratricopeptide repeat protein [Eubacteriales bacterium]